MMQHDFTIVSLSKFSDIFEELDNNIKQFAAGHPQILVRDGFLIEEAPGWMLLDGPENFNFSKNVNIGFNSVDPTHDIFFISDDVRLTAGGSIEQLQRLAYSDPNIGIMAPKVIGKADNPLQTNPPTNKEISYSNHYIVFVCLYLKRAAFNATGPMDGHTFCGYGWDDVDYSRRVLSAGFKLAVTPTVEVIHGVGKKAQPTTTFWRTESGRWDKLDKQNRINEEVYRKKWGDIKKEW